MLLLDSQDRQADSTVVTCLDPIAVVPLDHQQQQHQQHLKIITEVEHRDNDSHHGEHKIIKIVTEVDPLKD